MKKIFALSLLLAAFLAAGCQKEEVTTGTLRGTLTYDSENLIGASITISGDQGTFTKEAEY